MRLYTSPSMTKRAQKRQAKEKGRIRIADDVHQYHQYHSCAPHYHLQQLANVLTNTNSRQWFADIMRRKPTRLSTMPDNNSKTLLDCWSKPRHSK